MVTEIFISAGNGGINSLDALKNQMDFLKNQMGIDRKQREKSKKYIQKTGNDYLPVFSFR